MQEHIVKSYDEELNRLNKYLIDMLSAIKEQLSKTKELFFDSTENPDNIIQNDETIDLFDKHIVTLSLDIFSTRNPVAYDLRFVFSSSHISRNLERIGDNICKICYYTRDLKKTNKEIHIKPIQMMSLLLEMEGILKEALMLKTVDGVKKIYALDEQVDDLFSSTAKLVLTEMSHSPKDIATLNAYSLIARSLERIGDHFVNITRYVEFLEEGSLNY